MWNSLISPSNSFFYAHNLCNIDELFTIKETKEEKREKEERHKEEPVILLSKGIYYDKRTLNVSGNILLL